MELLKRSAILVFALSAGMGLVACQTDDGNVEPAGRAPVGEPGRANEPGATGSTKEPGTFESSGTPDRGSRESSGSGGSSGSGY